MYGAPGAAGPSAAGRHPPLAPPPAPSHLIGSMHTLGPLHAAAADPAIHERELAAVAAGFLTARSTGHSMLLSAPGPTATPPNTHAVPALPAGDPAQHVPAQLHALNIPTADRFWLDNMHSSAVGDPLAAGDEAPHLPGDYSFHMHGAPAAAAGPHARDAIHHPTSTPITSFEYLEFRQSEAQASLDLQQGRMHPSDIGLRGGTGGGAWGGGGSVAAAQGHALAPPRFQASLPMPANAGPLHPQQEASWAMAPGPGAIHEHHALPVEDPHAMRMSPAAGAAALGPSRVAIAPPPAPPAPYDVYHHGSGEYAVTPLEHRVARGSGAFGRAGAQGVGHPHAVPGPDIDDARGRGPGFASQGFDVAGGVPGGHGGRPVMWRGGGRAGGFAASQPQYMRHGGVPSSGAADGAGSERNSVHESDGGGSGVGGLHTVDRLVQLDHLYRYASVACTHAGRRAITCGTCSRESPSSAAQQTVCAL